MSVKYVLDSCMQLIAPYHLGLQKGIFFFKLKIDFLLAHPYHSNPIIGCHLNDESGVCIHVYEGWLDLAMNH